MKMTPFRLSRQKTPYLFLTLALVLSTIAAAQIALAGNGDFAVPSSVVPGDVNNDGDVNALDITTVERIIVGLDSETIGTHANNVIIFIGDGMGPAHRTAARYLEVGASDNLVLDTLPVTGMSRTYSASSLMTDSAAAATALACGTKTYNGAIGVDNDGNPVSTVLELAQAAGKATGLVTNVQITDATPAAFAAHVVSRDMVTEIARQQLALMVNVLLGGGEDEFLPTSETGNYPQPGERTDGRNLIAEAIAANYTYVWDKATFDAVSANTTARLLGLFADEGMARPYQPSLAEMTRKAIEVLSKDSQGFFLVVEGGQIDWASHSHNATNAINDTLDFSEAVAVAKEFTDRDRQTLLIVTADHETGGMTVIEQGQGPFYTPDGQSFAIGWSTDGHSAVDIPTSAQGPRAVRLTGYYENTHIYEVMVEAMGLSQF